jgi:hypothetical protein
MKFEVEYIPGTITIKTTNNEEGWAAIKRLNELLSKAKVEKFSDKIDRQRRERNKLKNNSRKR